MAVDYDEIADRVSRMLCGWHLGVSKEQWPCRRCRKIAAKAVRKAYHEQIDGGQDG